MAAKAKGDNAVTNDALAFDKVSKLASDIYSLGSGKVGDAGSASEAYDALYAAGVRALWIGAPDSPQSKVECASPNAWRVDLRNAVLAKLPEAGVTAFRRMEADKSARKYMTAAQVKAGKRVREALKNTNNKLKQGLAQREAAAEKQAIEDRKEALRAVINDEAASAEDRDAARLALDLVLQSQAEERWERVRESVAGIWKSIAGADGSVDDDALLVEHSAEMQPCFVALFKAAGWDLPEDMKA